MSLKRHLCHHNRWESESEQRHARQWITMEAGFDSFEQGPTPHHFIPLHWMDLLCVVLSLSLMVHHNGNHASLGRCLGVHLCMCECLHLNKHYEIFILQQIKLGSCSFICLMNFTKIHPFANQQSPTNIPFPHESF